MAKILLIGDIVGAPGRHMIRKTVKRLRTELGLCGVIANAENAAGGSGLTGPVAYELRDAGIDAITLGDHTWGQKEFASQIDALNFVVRPANYPRECPGRGWRLITLPMVRIAVINLQGRTFMNPANCPFKAADKALSEIPKNVPVFIDFHAEATSEKIAFANYVDGRATAVVGTHTHVQTSDAFVLPRGTAYLTDLGMTGPYISSLGRELKPVIRKFTTGMPGRFEIAEGPCTLEGAIIEFDPKTRLATSISTFREREPLKAEANGK